MEREIIRTEDGSTTIRIPQWDECYHSKHGAIQEAYHVFIKNGLSIVEGKAISIMEIGFGTGLNAFITFLEAKKTGRQVNYVGVEAFPISVDEAAQMNYVEELQSNEGAVFNQMHEGNWETELALTSEFTLTKKKLLFSQINYTEKFDLVYFDAFGFGVQPELWSAEIFKIMYDAIKPKGMLVTYAARGIIKRNMQEAGFIVRKVAGPPGKWEMMIAFKNYF